MDILQFSLKIMHVDWSNATVKIEEMPYISRDYARGVP